MHTCIHAHIHAHMHISPLDSYGQRLCLVCEERVGVKVMMFRVWGLAFRVPLKGSIRVLYGIHRVQGLGSRVQGIDI